MLTAKKRRIIDTAKTISGDIKNRMFAEMYTTAIQRRVELGDSSLFDFLSDLERTPVSIEAFIDDPEFLGATDLVLWPEVRRAVVEINCNWWAWGDDAKKSYNEAVLCGATGTGKTSISIVSTLYHLYLLSCLKNPQGIYGFPRATSIVFAIMGAKPRVVNKVIYLPMRKLAEAMPYFQKYFMPDKLIESEMYFSEKNIRVAQSGGDEDAILGEAIIGGVIDEINFMNVVLRSKKAEVTSGRAGLYDQAEQVHATMQRRKRGRFTRPGPMIGLVFASSSTRYKGDFTDKRKAQIEKTGVRTAYVYSPRQYDVVPKERFSGKTFRLLIGNDVHHDTRVLKDTDSTPAGAWIEDIPIEYLDDFTNRPYDALRDVLGISNNALQPFIKTRHKVYECVQEGTAFGLESILVRDHVILGEHGMPQVKSGAYCQNPSRPRYVHIDLSRNGDRCVAKGQKVLMADRSYKAIEQVRTGDFVVTKDGTVKPVVACHTNGVKSVLRVSVYGWDESLCATGNHMVWAVRRSAVSYADGRLIKPSDSMFSGRSQKSARARYNYVPEFVRLDSLRPGDFLVTPRPVTPVSHSIAGVPLSYEAGYIAGLFAAEGSYWTNRNQEYVQFSLHKNEVRIAAQLSEYLSEVFKVRTRIQPDARHDGVTLRVTKSQQLVDFLLAAIGEYSNRKHFLGAGVGSKDFHAGLAHGYVDGDGYVRYNAAGEPVSLSVKTISPFMARQFYWMLVSYGFTPCIGYEDGYTQVESGREVVRQAAYTIKLSGTDQMDKFRFWRKGHVEVPCSHALALPDYLLSPIVDIQDGGLSNVFDLTVLDESSYVVGNSVVHNCGISMVRFEGMTRVQRQNGISELMPKAIVEMACTITPDANAEIDIAEVRAFVKHLKDKYGYPIKGVSYDGFDCVEENTLIWTNRGYLAAKDVQVGDMVQSRIGPRAVLQKMEYFDVPTFLLETDHGYSLEATGRHMVEALDYWVTRDGGRHPVWAWLRLEELHEGQVIRIWDEESTVDVENYVPLLTPNYGNAWKEVIDCPTFLTEDVAEFLGLMWGDGYIGKNAISMTFYNGEEDDACELIQRVFEPSNAMKIRYIKGANYCQMDLWNAELVAWLDINDFRKPAIPSQILASKKSVQAAFLRGLFATDGSVKARDGQVSLSTVNKRTAQYVQNTLSVLFGMKTNITRIDYSVCPPSKKTSEPYHYIVQVQGSRKDFMDRIGLTYERKRQQLQDHIAVKGRNIFTKVTRLTETEGNVVDFEIAEDHAYVVNGFVSHNSRESIQAWRKGGMRAAMISVDRTSVPYKQFRDALNDLRILLPDNEILLTELLELEYDATKDKIDHPVTGCFTGDTLVRMPDGTARAFESLITFSSLGVLSYDGETEIVSRAFRPRVTKEVSELIELELENGRTIRCTPEHRFLLQSGEYKEAQHLTMLDDLQD